MHPADLDVDSLLKECEVQRTRRGGPGGQHRNKVESAVVILHKGSGCKGEASERRDQHQNKKLAIKRLRIELAIHVRSKRAELSDLWKSRTVNQRILINPDHENFASLLAEAIDAVAEFEFDIPRAADSLKVSNSQLLKFLKLEKQVFHWLNQNRVERGLRPLK